MRPHVRRVKCILRFFIFTAGGLVLLSVLILKNTSVNDLTELEKCPACYGVTFCPSINSGRVTLYPFSSWFNVKNVFYAHSPLGTVLLKKLGHDWELSALDQELCHLVGHKKDAASQDDCVLSDIVWKLPDIKNTIFDIIRSNKTIRSGFTFCPAVDSSQIDEIVDRIALRSKGIGYKTILTNMLTSIIINPEPIILQAFPRSEGWPFPKFLGACGRVVAEAHAGHRISRLLGSSWLTRASVALQLLEAARQLTFQDPRYALYLTDLSLDNLVVDKGGNVVIVDLGNVIVVDKYPPWNVAPEGWQEMHTSDTIEDCEMCFSFSTDDVCSHQASDHNYYAVCQFLAQHSWLAEPPPDVKRSYPQLESLLHECLSPEMERGRYVAARHLIPILANLTVSKVHAAARHSSS